MASTFTHAFVGYSFARLFYTNKATLKILIAAMICGNLPDFDVVLYLMGFDDFHVLGHRGITHSIVFSLLVIPLVLHVVLPKVDRFSSEWWKSAGFFWAVIFSHDLLDATTDGNIGVAFFAPFDSTRYFFGTRLLIEAPMYDDFIDLQSIWALFSEFFVICVPLWILILGAPYVTVALREQGAKLAYGLTELKRSVVLLFFRV